MGPQRSATVRARLWKALRRLPRRPRATLLGSTTGNVLNKGCPRVCKRGESPQGAPARHLDGRNHVRIAESAFDIRDLEAYGPSRSTTSPRACLAKDRGVLLTFYDFPAEHWKHVRTTNPIESTFATVRLRTYRTKGCLSRKTAMAMVFKLCQCAQRKWRKLDGSNHLAEIIRGVKFVDGERQDRAAA